MNINPKSLFGGMCYGGLKHGYLLFKSSEYRNLVRYVSRFSWTPRFQETTVQLNGQSLLVPDVASFISQYEEIYVNRIYDIPMHSPRILDLGANIGLSVLWASKHFKDPEIVAVEADPKIFEYLKGNAASLSDVTLLHCAVWNKDEEIPFYSEGADGGRLDVAHTEDQIARVQTVDVRKIIEKHGPFDFVKMDIEGAESKVLPACRGTLSETKYLFCEYHSTEGERQYLAEILAVLTDEGFRFHLQPINISKQPFLKRNINAGFDLQLNIFAWKPY